MNILKQGINIYSERKRTLIGDDQMELYISTFGNFDIKIGNESLLQETSRSYRLFKLFQYFMTFKNKKLLPETIIDNLWEDTESHDPKNMLRAQIFRLRKIIKGFLPEDANEEDYMIITFNNGYYSLEIGDNAILDFQVFESKISKADTLIFTNRDQAIEEYKAALRLYKGIYLEENSYDIWLIPVRNYYKRLYLKTLFKLLDIYKNDEKHDKIIELCESSTMIEPDEEIIHIYMMEAMLKLGQINNAMSHYEYFSAILEKEKGTNSTPAMRDIKLKIQNYYAEKSELDIINVERILEDPEEGPLHCDLDYFRLVFNKEKRERRPKDHDPDFISLISSKYEYNCSSEKVKRWAKLMEEVLDKTLRKGDIYTFWNDTQIIILLQTVKREGLGKIEDRIRKNMEPIMDANHFKTEIKFIPIASESNIN